jgi:murein L,D-transpeptidase YafK
MKKLLHTMKISFSPLLAFVLFTLFLITPVFSGEESFNELELLKKISSNYIKKAIESSKNLEEAAKNIGITQNELKQICRTLSITIDFYNTEEVDITSLPSVQKLSSDEYEPDVIIDYNGDYPYILLVEKDVHKIYLLKYENGQKNLLGVYDCKTGKNRGDKREEGDHKTPEGIFFLVRNYSRNDILKMVGKSQAYQYGEMAFATDFPNHIDQMNGKNGSGIWLHGTDEPFSESSPLDTRGCVVTTNETIKNLSKHIVLQKTPLIIVNTLKFNTKAEHMAQRKALLDILEDWRSTWEGKRLENYIQHYSEKFKASGRNRSQLKSYKSAIFNSYEINHIKLDNIILLKYEDGMIAKFDQDYSASNIKAKNGKELYFVKENNSWGIITERIRN